MTPRLASSLGNGTADGVTVTGSGSAALTLRGTASAVSAYLASANRVVFDSVAWEAPYTLTVTAQRTSGSTVTASAIATSALTVFGHDVVATADVVSASGNVSVHAKDAVVFGTNADIRTASGSNAARGSIDVWAETRSITQHASSVFTSSGSAATARLRAGTNVTVGDIELPAGRVSITAVSGSVLDADGLVTSGVSRVNDADQDIIAAGLRMSAGSAVAESVNHLETTVATLTAIAANGGIWVLEADSLTVGDVGLSVNRVLMDASTATAQSTDATQSDVRTTGGNGAIVLRTVAGSLTLTNGSAPGAGSSPVDSVAVSAHGTGNVLLQAQGVNADLNVDASVAS
ncbi:MAG: hypothetical protein EB027_08120, partial [Actinobacteria bacterium]|nr:hypothetical protein [Actinomycetota bacterium]